MRLYAAFLPLLLPLAINALYPFGASKGDLNPTSDWFSTSVDIPIVYLGQQEKEIFVSNQGIVSFGEKLPDGEFKSLKELGKSAIAVYYAPVRGGNVFVKSTSSDRQLLQKVSDDIRDAFSEDLDFKALQVVIVTWENMVSKEGRAGNTFQLVLATDGVQTFVLNEYKMLTWAKSAERFALVGFSHKDGKYQPSVNSGSETATDLVNLANTDDQGKFLFRISGHALEDPKDDDYEYTDYENDYDGQSQKPRKGHKKPRVCPPDPFLNNCPAGCSVLTDNNGCSKCVCAGKTPPQKPETNAVDEEPEVPVSKEEEEEELHPLDPRVVERTKQRQEKQQQQRPENNDPEKKPAEPEASNRVDTPSQERGTCQPNSCHKDAKCQEYPPGFCCACSPSFYGNGKECLKKGDPQRITGTVEGAINGRRLENIDLHTFVTGTDGNAYTAINRVPADLAPSLQFLTPIGSIMGWLFATVNSHLVYNGFQLTGGVLNRTATIHIDSNVITLKQHFTGKNRYDYYEVSVVLTGTLPEVSAAANFSFVDHDEEYRRESPGFVRSYATQEVSVTDNGSTRKYRMTVDQQIHYNECQFKEFDKTSVVTLNVKRPHVTYNINEGIVRFVSRNFADTRKTARPEHKAPETGAQSSQNVQQDACATGRHVCTLPNMRCRVFDPSYRCECLPGFQAKHDTTSQTGFVCVDVDECSGNEHTCHIDAECTNTDGGFRCRCRQGFVGDGFQCSSPDIYAPDVQPQQPHPHHPHHHHHEAEGRDGHPAHTVPHQHAKSSCANHHDCHQWGECVFTPGLERGTCKCRGWYVGDGVEHCGPPEKQKEVHAPAQRPEQQPQQPPARPHERLNANVPPHRGQPCGSFICDANAECMPARDGQSECVCRVGFHGNGVRCESLLDERPESPGQPVKVGTSGTVCRSHDECSPQGSCAYDAQAGYYQCACRPPYEGDGVRCELARSDEEPTPPASTSRGGAEEQGCDVLRNCGRDADCIFVKPRFRCACRSGFTGDGFRCVAVSQGIPELLPPLPQQPNRPHEGCERCSADARCVFDSASRRFVCECASGFLGDGLTCLKIAGSAANWEGRDTPPKTCRDLADCHASAHCVQNDRGAYFCQCLPGFRGDGVTSCKAADQCSPADPRSCAQNAECVYGETEGAYVCKCVAGFTGDGVRCLPHAPPQTCDRNPRLCHHNAQCVYNHQRKEYGCLCKPGTQGDGYRQCDRIEVPQCTGCHQNAHCVLAQNGASRCQCANGFVGNGIVCSAQTTCLDDRSLCSEHADCVPGEGGRYVCNCRYGFRGNGRICSPEASKKDTLFVARGMAIIQRGTHPEVLGKQLILNPHHVAVGLDFDCVGERIVWSDVTGHFIRTATLQGTNMSTFFGPDVLDSPEGIAVDYHSRNVYYADSQKDEIGVASLDGKYQKALVTEGLVNPRAVAIDLANKKLYFADWHRESPFIARVDLDGQNLQKFVQDDIHIPNGIVILPRLRELCWVDAGVKRLSCISLDGGQRRTVYSNLNYPFGVTHLNEERFYWTDWKDNRIHSVDVYGNAYASMPISLGSSGKAYGILGLPEDCSTASSPCAVNNGGCAGLCVPSSDPSGFRCLCPDNDKSVC